MYIESARAFYKENETHLSPYYSASTPIIRELREVCPTVGDISSVLQCSVKEYVRAVPILIKWFRQVDEQLTRNALVRALSSRHAREAAPLLLDAFRQESTSDSLRYTISRALEAMADESIYSELVDLARQRKYCKFRHGIVLALSKMRNPAVVEVLIGQLDDPAVTRQAVRALERRVDPRSRSALEPYTDHPDWFVQRYARRAITKIEKKEAKQRRKAQATRWGHP